MKYSLIATIVVAMFGAANAQEVCRSPDNTFRVKVNLFAGELGYYEFEECTGPNPTIGMEVGETYTFVQTDVSNFYHPLGFSYIPDGAHADAPELEPGVTQGTSGCDATLTCPAPMYYKDGVYLGVYSNLDNATAVADEDFGLDAYEPEFFYPITDWVAAEYTIQLRFDDTTFSQDIFYFCHIHQFMTGRIKLLQNDTEIQPMDDPELGYTYDEPGDFDQQCGTFGLDMFALPNDLCPTTFVCDTDESDNAELQQFAECIDAMNCHMFQGMTTGIASNSDVALFIHQMIPHHQNAVNMAKLLLQSPNTACDDLTEETPACVMNVIAREIINGQNFQIQAMRGVLEAGGYLDEDNCEISLATKEPHVHPTTDTPVASPGVPDPTDTPASSPGVPDPTEAPSPSPGSSSRALSLSFLYAAAGYLF